MSGKNWRNYWSLTEKLKKVGEKFVGNQVVSKIEQNDKPEHSMDTHRASCRVVIDHKVGRQKSMPTLNIYDASDLDLEKLQNSLISAAISVINTRMKLAQANRDYDLNNRLGQEAVGLNKTHLSTTKEATD